MHYLCLFLKQTIGQLAILRQAGSLKQPILFLSYFQSDANIPYGQYLLGKQPDNGNSGVSNISTTIERHRRE